MLQTGEERPAIPSLAAANFNIKYPLIAAFLEAEWHSSSIRTKLGNDTAAPSFPPVIIGMFFYD